MIEPAPHPEGTTLAIKAQPGARKNAVLGERAGALRVAVSAAPERNRANEAIADVLADALGVRAARVRLVGGATSRDKRFLIEDMTPDDLRARLESLLGPTA